jgi:hypothetical protein
MFAALNAALARLEAWVRQGTAPPKFGRIKTTGTGDGIEVVRDNHGIALGGVRTPLVDVPLAANVGDGGNSPDLCRVFGHIKVFDAATLAQLYPGGKSEYVEKFDRSADRAVRAGVWLKPESENFKAAASVVALG